MFFLTLVLGLLFLVLCSGAFGPMLWHRRLYSRMNESFAYFLLLLFFLSSPMLFLGYLWLVYKLCYLPVWLLSAWLNYLFLSPDSLP